MPFSKLLFLVAMIGRGIDPSRSCLKQHLISWFADQPQSLFREQPSLWPIIAEPSDDLQKDLEEIFQKFSDNLTHVAAVGQQTNRFVLVEISTLLCLPRDFLQHFDFE